MKKLTKSIALVAIAAIAGYNTYQMSEVNAIYNDLSLANIENIADAETAIQGVEVNTKKDNHGNTQTCVKITYKEEEKKTSSSPSNFNVNTSINTVIKGALAAIGVSYSYQPDTTSTTKIKEVCVTGVSDSNYAAKIAVEVFLNENK